MGDVERVPAQMSPPLTRPVQLVLFPTDGHNAES
jgi:hypothetical protein